MSVNTFPEDKTTDCVVSNTHFPSSTTSRRRRRNRRSFKLSLHFLPLFLLNITNSAITLPLMVQNDVLVSVEGRMKLEKEQHGKQTSWYFNQRNSRRRTGEGHRLLSHLTLDTIQASAGRSSIYLPFLSLSLSLSLCCLLIRCSVVDEIINEADFSSTTSPESIENEHVL